MQRSLLSSRDRTGAMLAVLLVHVGLALLVFNSAGRVDAVPEEEQAIETFDVTETPPTPPPPPPVVVEVPAKKKPKEEGAASAPNIKSEATPVRTPLPKVELPPSNPLATSQTPAMGAQPTQGAAPVPGPGTGAGGIGTGTGSGAQGGGSGGGGGIASGPRQIAGRITRRDYPRELRNSRVPLEVIRLQYVIGPDGAVRDCRILQSSGTPLLDAHTCRLYEQRYRYIPARDRNGQPVPITVRATRSWYIRGEGPPLGE